MNVEELAREPSPEAWRLLCQALDKLPVPEALAAIETIEPLLATWPDELRATMCGMTWDDEFFAGQPNPRSTIVRYLRFETVFIARYDHSIRMRPRLNADSMRTLITSPAVKHLTRINLGSQLDGNGVDALARGRYFEKLEWLQLSGTKRAPLVRLAAAEFFGRLRRLDLSGGDLTDNVGPLFREIGPHELILDGNPLDVAGATVIAKKLQQRPQRLGLARCQLGDEGAAALAKISHELLALDLTDNGITDRGIAKLTSGPLRVRELSIAKSSITRIDGLLAASWPLTHLRLDDNALDDRAAFALAERGPTTLEVLSLADNDVTAKGLAALLGSPRLRALRSLDLGTNRIGAFREAGVELGVLETLKLAHNRLGDGIRALAAIASDALTTLELANNLVDVRALEELTGAAWFSRLLHLDLSDNPLGPGAGVVFGALPVETLDLSNTGLGEIGAMTMFDAGMQPKQLSLDRCGLTDTALEHLARSPMLAKIEILSLRGNEITDRGVHALVEAAPSRLLQIRVDNNQIGDAGVIELATWPQLLFVGAEGNRTGTSGEAALEKRPVRCCP